ncbi:MAG: hemerythrin family protein [Myxococcota bacterium]
MAYFEWTDKFDLHIDSMDGEHKKLISLMNQIYDLNEKKAKHDDIKRVVLALESATVQHFQHEEELMTKMAYPKLSTHKLIHKKLLEDFGKHKESFVAARGGLDLGFFNFLKGWLAAHIAGIDQQYAAHSRGMKLAG